MRWVNVHTTDVRICYFVRIAEKLITTPDTHNNGRMGFTSQQ